MEYLKQIPEGILFRVMFVAIALIVIATTMTGCGRFDNKVAEYVGSAKTCIDGVQYIQFKSGASVAYTPDGEVKTCK